MTKDQALEFLKEYTETNFSERCRDAHNMAINALEQQPSDDCVSRQAVFETIDDCNSDGLKGIFCSYDDGERFKEYIKKLPPVTPTHGTCKDCEHWKDSDGVYRRGVGAESKCTINISRVFEGTFYCDDFESRGKQ